VIWHAIGERVQGQVVSYILYALPRIIIRVITSMFMVEEGYWGVEKCIRNFGILGNGGADGSK
jgi:hypothetical protein